MNGRNSDKWNNKSQLFLMSIALSTDTSLKTVFHKNDCSGTLSLPSYRTLHYERGFLNPWKELSDTFYYPLTKSVYVSNGVRSAVLSFCTSGTSYKQDRTMAVFCHYICWLWVGYQMAAAMNNMEKCPWDVK